MYSREVQTYSCMATVLQSLAPGEHDVSNTKVMGLIPRECMNLSIQYQFKSLWIKASARCINVKAIILFWSCFWWERIPNKVLYCIFCARHWPSRSRIGHPWDLHCIEVMQLISSCIPCKSNPWPWHWMANFKRLHKRFYLSSLCCSVSRCQERLPPSPVFQNEMHNHS